jgi:hypothetical protein
MQEAFENFYRVYIQPGFIVRRMEFRSAYFMQSFRCRRNISRTANLYCISHILYGPLVNLHF